MAKKKKDEYKITVSKFFRHLHVVNEHRFLLLFVGVITGVGGGMIRDMMAQQIPFILVKQIYACASLAGAGVCIWLMPYHKSASMILGAVVVVIIRILAATYRWDLPKIE